MGHVTFIGLGRMGAKMCRLLLEAGYPVSYVIHEHRETADDFAARYPQFRIAASYAQALAESQIVCTMLPADPEFADVVFDDAFLDALRPGMTLIDLSSVSRTIMQRADRALTERGVAFIDSPISGPAGSCLVIASGDERVVQAMTPFLRAMCGDVAYCGRAGNGSLIKSLNNLMLMVNATGAAECAQILRETPEIDPELFASIIARSSGYSEAFKNGFLPFFVNENHDVSHEFWSSCKDMRNGLDEVQRTPTPLFSLCYQLMRLNAEHDHDNWSSLIELYRRAQ